MFAITIKQLNILLLVAGLIVAFPFRGSAAELPIAADDKLTIMPRIKIEATRISSTTGMVLIDKELIDNLPTRNGSVNEIVGVVPGVQFSEDVNNSFTAGEIRPPGISISGSLPFENNYTIDGVSNNSLTDPANDINDANKIPGHPQSQFLSPRFIEQIKIYNSNIPAEFGGFTGGQVNVKTIDPTPEFWGNINYRTTRNNWTKFYISDIDEDKFNNSSSEDFQPKFKKHDAGFILNLPINNNTGVITAYQQLNSEILLTNFYGTNTQTRKRENFLLKLAHDVSNTTRVSMTTLWSPTEDNFFFSNAINSDYFIKSNSYSVALNIETEFESGLLNITFGYNGQAIERSGDRERFRWDDSTPSIDWEDGFTGSHGRLEKGHNELSFKADYSLEALSLVGTEHRLKLGSDAKSSTQNYKRPETNYYYYYSGDTTGAISCTNGDPACITNEQYLNRRTVYYSGESETETQNIAVYLQDEILWQRLEITPGLRASYNSISEKVNVAPRLSTSLDLFGNRNSILFFGKNRYYSGTLHTFSLYKTIKYENQSRTSADPEGWSSTGASNARVDGPIETPYTDEVTVGAMQKVLGGELKLQYIQKKTRDGITRTYDKILKEYTLKNNGRAENESYLISWQRSWKKHFFEINSTWQETTSNYTDQETDINDDTLLSSYFFEGKEYFKHESPRKDFNRPVVANLIYSGKLPYGVTFTNVTKFRGPYTWLKNTLQTTPSIISPEQGSDPFIFEKKRQHSSLLFDWKISWKIPQFANNNAVLTLDIYNVFNRKTNYSAGSDDYELGRQYWAGIDFNF